MGSKQLVQLYPSDASLPVSSKDGYADRMESSWNDAGVFKTKQDAFQFYVTEDGVEMAGE